MQARLDYDGEYAALTMTNANVPAWGTALYVAYAYDEDGKGGQIGYKYLDGQQIGLYLFDTAAGKQYNHDEAVQAVLGEGSSLVGRVPWPFGEIVEWSAAVSVDGDEFSCPGVGETLPL